MVGLASDQTNLLAANCFLTIVNIVGVWRLLGKQRAYEYGGKSAAEASRGSAYATPFTATSIAVMPVAAIDGKSIGKAIEALAACDNVNVSYVVVATSGVGGVREELHGDIKFACDILITKHSDGWFQELPLLADGDWPV